MKILFVYQKPISFIKKDIEILCAEYQVKEVVYGGVRDVINIYKGVKECDVTFSWFGKMHAFFTVMISRIMGKRSIVVAGGDDVAKRTALGRPYGVLSHPVKRIIGKLIFRMADTVIAISKYNYLEVIENTGIAESKVRLVPHGFDSLIYKRPSNIQKEKMVCTVGFLSHENMWRKGFGVIKETSRLMPEIEFRIIGPPCDSSVDILENDAPINFKVIRGLYGADLVEMLGRTSVYLQISEWESFGCALAEAMLCECIPVVYPGTALPEVVGDKGVYVESIDPTAIALAIEKAMCNIEKGSEARKRIIESYGLEARKRSLMNVIKER